MGKEFDKLIKFKIEALQEDLQIEGNVLASGDKAEDKMAEQSVIDQLNSGNYWAWCTIKVTAHVEGIPEVEGTDYLGGCSYKSEKDFKKDGYYKDMCNTARDDLMTQLKSLKIKLNKFKQLK